MEQILRLNDYFKKRFGDKVYKISLNGGMSCPNRDGTLGYGGCIFCSEGGSGDFATPSFLSITEQINEAIIRISSKVKVDKYIAYFQAYTNTYASVEYLEKIFTEAIVNPQIVALSIGTRPDCLPNDVIELLNRLNTIKPIFVELGFQTSNESTAKLIRRCYNNKVFSDAVNLLSEAGIETIVHVIIGLPTETELDVLNTIRYINTLPVSGVKLQLMHILKNTELSNIYLESPELFKFMALDDYVNTVCKCISILRSDIVIHRLTGDGPKNLLIAPLWSGNKKLVLNTINKALRDKNIIQGKEE